jgi:DNA polymerase III delta subunit
MIAIFYGNDRLRLVKEANAFIGKQDVDEIISFDETNVSAEEILNFAEQGALFGGKKLIRLDGSLEVEEILKVIIDEVELLAKSDNIFVFIESSILASDLKKIKSHAKICQEFKTLEKKKETFNVFSLADALARRDKKTLWVMYQKALRSGKSPEEISGTLFWQLKTLAILEQGGGSTLSPYVVSKNKMAVKNFKTGEILDITSRLIQGYHRARRGVGDMEVVIERLILSI